MRPHRCRVTRRSTPVAHMRSKTAAVLFIAFAPALLQASARAQDFCADYAKHAIQQIQLMMSHPNCRVTPVMRWQPNFQTHYNGCRISPTALMKHEENEREKWLTACGAIAPAAVSNASGGPADANAALSALLATPADNVDTSAVPVGLVMCEAGGCEQGNTGTWILRGANGIARWPKGQVAKLTVLRFDATGILIRREDPPNSTSPGFVAVYEGTRQGDRIDGKVHSAWPGPGHFPNGKPPGTADYQFYATIPHTTCASVDNGLDEPVEIAQTAVKFKQQTAAFACFLIAARQGNPLAKGVVSVMYRDGIGTDPNAEQAFHWAQLGAQQQDYNSELTLSQMYETGIGTPPDADKAKYWQDRAQKNPVVLQAQAQAQAQANMQKMALMGMAALVEAMSTPDVIVLR
jgi:hypothetical protein